MEVVILPETVIINDRSFLIDKYATSHYITQYNEPCDCAYCRNYFRAIQENFVVLDFLSKLSVNVGRPEECMEIETNYSTKMLHYIVWYSVTGQTENSVTVNLSDDITVKISLSSDNRLSPNTDHIDDYFWICIDLWLPWAMDEDISKFKSSEKSLS